jgi:hypothetical protein
MTPTQQRLVRNALEEAIEALVDAEVSMLMRRGDFLSVEELLRDGKQYLGALTQLAFAIALAVAPDCSPTATTLDQLVDARWEARMRRQEREEG